MGPGPAWALPHGHNIMAHLAHGPIIGVGTERRRGEGGPGDSAAHAAQARGGQGVWEISPLAVLGGRLAPRHSRPVVW